MCSDIIESAQQHKQVEVLKGRLCAGHCWEETSAAYSANGRIGFNPKNDMNRGMRHGKKHQHFLYCAKMMAGRVHDATPFLLGGKELTMKQCADLSSHVFSQPVLSHFRARRGAGGRS